MIWVASTTGSKRARRRAWSAVIGPPHENRVRTEDALLYVNFRPDRARQLTLAFTEPDFDGFDRGPDPPLPFVTTMTRYKAEFRAEVLFEAQDVRQGLSETVSAAGRTQLHVAETEKYAHVTYFFNGGREAPLPGEDRRLVPSPKVATYDLQPEMSAAGVADEVVTAIASDGYDLIVANFANPDMVGHTGVWEAAVAACETIDACLGRIAAALAAHDAADPAGAGSLLAVTADHGNADAMRDAMGNPVTAHSLNPVPLLLVGRPAAGRILRYGVLADVAPTLLELAGLPPWEGMTGRSLLGPVAGSGREPVLSSDAVPTGGPPQ